MRTAPAILLQCAIPKCPRKGVARGLCHSCYTKARYYGMLKLPREKKVYLKLYIPERIEVRMQKAVRMTGKTQSQLAIEAFERYLDPVPSPK